MVAAQTTMKCDLCGGKIETHFLEKIKGTYIKKGGKLKIVCPACQKKYTQKEITTKV